MLFKIHDMLQNKVKKDFSGHCTDSWLHKMGVMGLVLFQRCREFYGSFSSFLTARLTAFQAKNMVIYLNKSIPFCLFGMKI